jgi:hypothetical protein
MSSKTRRRRTAPRLAVQGFAVVVIASGLGLALDAVDIVPAFAGSTATTMTITSVTQSPVVGEPISISVEVDAASPSSTAPAPSGSVTVTDGANTCDVALGGADGVAGGACEIVETAPGTPTFNASYAGDGNYAGSSAPSGVEETVAKASTTTTITPSTANPVVGQSLSVGVEVASAFPAAGVAAPSTPVTVTLGSGASCQATPSGVDGVGLGSCRIPIGSTGATTLAAAFAGDGNFVSSASATSDITVGEDSSVTKLSLSTAPVYGDEQATTISVAVAAQYPAAPVTGTASVAAGSAKLCPAVIVGGAGSCTLTATQLPAGPASFVATYGGDSSVLSSFSSADSVTVAKDTASLLLTLSSATAVPGKEQSLKIGVTLSLLFPETVTGPVTVSAGKVVLCTIKTLSGGKGTCSPTAKALAAGSYSVTASYAGTTDFTSALSTAAALKVT